jgi:hypothetical protein
MIKILDASPGYGGTLTEQEIKDFLTTKVLNVHLGTCQLLHTDSGKNAFAP